jgi:hypothetical protein
MIMTFLCVKGVKINQTAVAASNIFSTAAKVKKAFDKHWQA